MKKVVFNFRILLYATFAVLFAFGAVMCAVGEWKSVVAVIIFSVFLLTMLAAFIFSPILFVFDEEKLKIQYFFGFYLIIKWNSIQQINKSPIRRGGLFLRDYNITLRGKAGGKPCFFTGTEINATRKTKRLLQEFWNADFDK